MPCEMPAISTKLALCQLAARVPQIQKGLELARPPPDGPSSVVSAIFRGVGWSHEDRGRLSLGLFPGL
ncbi:hypothetical protein VTN96DRAFT_6400 [Rasamsonia emersonii]